MSEFTVVQSKRGRKPTVKKNKKDTEEKDEYDLALDSIEMENEATYQRIKSTIASQLSDTDGIDAGLLSTPELKLRANQLLTEDNPKGRPPGLDVTEPDMKDLLARLDTYASITRRGSLASMGHSFNSGLTSPTGGTSSKIEVPASASTKKTIAKASKSVKFSVSSPPAVVPKRQPTKSSGFSVSTTQKLKGERKQSDRSRDCPINLLGDYVKGTKRLASSALGKVAVTIPSGKDDMENISEFSGSSDDSEVEMKRKRSQREDDDSFDFPLLPESALISNGNVDVIESSPDSSYDGNGVNDDKSEDPPSSQQLTDDSQSLRYFLPKELEELKNGHESELFYEHVLPLSAGVNQYTPPLVHANGVFQQVFSCPPSCILPPLTDSESVLTDQERRSCESEEWRCKYHYVCHKAFSNKLSIDEVMDDLLRLTKDGHLSVIMMGEGLTNSVWCHTNTLQHDVEKFWYYLKNYGKVACGTIVMDPGLIPIRTVKLEFLLQLPIAGVFHYLQHHGIDIATTPWKLVSPTALVTLQQLPVDSHVPYEQWREYLIALLVYLHTIMDDEETAYTLIHHHYRMLEAPAITEFDAEKFLAVHFPYEERKLKTSATTEDDSKYRAQLSRAIAFGLSRKYRGEVYDKCSEKWAVFLYFMLHKKYPPKLNGKHDSEFCVKALVDVVTNRHRMPLDFERLTHSHPSVVTSMLEESPLAFRLYGNTGRHANVGVQMLMAAGVAYMYFWLSVNASAKHKRSNIDEIIPLALLAYILSARGILAPINDGEPHFESRWIPVHSIGTVHESAATLIRTKEPCVLSIPPARIAKFTPDDVYQRHFEGPIKASKDADITLMNQELAKFHKTSSTVKGFTNNLCLFPLPKVVKIEDRTLSCDGRYLTIAGTRLVRSMRQTEQRQSDLRIAAMKKNSPKRQSFIVQENGTISISGKPPLVETISLNELKRRNIEKQRNAAISGLVPSTEDVETPLLLKARYGLTTHIIDKFDAYKDVKDMFSTDWGTLTGGFEGNKEYLDQLRFYATDSRPVTKGDGLILLYDISKDTTKLNACSHFLYMVNDVVGSKVYARLQYNMFRPSGPEHVAAQIPTKIMIRVSDRYLLFEESRGASSASPLASTKRGDSPSDSALHLQSDEDDVGSEESDARRLTKSSIIQMSRRKVEVVGKSTIRDDLQRAAALFNVQEKGRLEDLLAPVGVYGHTITAANIIDGMCRHNMADSDFLDENLNMPAQHNKSLVMNQAWYSLKGLHTNMAFQIYHLSANMKDDSIRCVHFLQQQLAQERNYLLLNWQDWVLHLEGYKQVVRELLGNGYFLLIQKIVLEIQNLRIGALSSVAYLENLSNSWRAQFYHFASRDVPFKAPGEVLDRYPSKMTDTDWVDVMELQWVDFKRKLTFEKEMAYNYAQDHFKIQSPKPMGHKVKLVQQVLPKMAGDKQPKVVKAKAVVKVPANKHDGKKRPAVEETVNVCLGDLLKHYGSTEQLSCKDPCRYVHYDAIPSSTSRHGLLQRSLHLADILKLSESTKSFLKQKINNDKKFR